MKLILFYHVLEMSLEASFIILFVLMIRLFLKEKPKIFSYVLWIAVFLRLLCPISIDMPFSVVPEKVTSGTAMKDMTDTIVGKYQKHWNQTKEFDAAIENGMEPIIQKNEAGNTKSAYVLTAEDGLSNPDTIYNAWLPQIGNIWIMGIVILIIYSITKFLKVKKAIVGAVPYDEEKEIYLVDFIETAFVMGIFYPRIYLPSSLSKKELEYILMHEKHHIRRKDYKIKAAAFFCLCIHWFNPFVWIAFTEMTKDMEMSCDEAVLKKIGIDIREEYVASLLGLTTGRKIAMSSFLGFGEGKTKERIKNALKWKPLSIKMLLFLSIVCILSNVVSMANIKSDTITHPYAWTSNIDIEEIDDCMITFWKDGSSYDLTKKQWKDLIYVLNELPKSAITNKLTPVKKEITLLISCDKKEYLLTYGNGITMISFDYNTSLQFVEKVWQTEDARMAYCIENLISHVQQNQKVEIDKKILPPTKSEVLEMRAKVLEGMNSQEISRLTELIQAENQNREYKYVKGNKNTEFEDPESPYWKLLTQTGNIQLGWGISCSAPGFDPEGDMSEEEYYEKYGTPYMYTVDVPWAEKLYARIDEFRSLIKSDYLDKDFEALEQCMQKAVETHDVNYLHEIYYRLHDLDYYLFRYGPEDVGKITDDDSTARKYYGALEIYNNILPKMISGKAKVSTESYKEYWESGLECVMRSYYKMSDGHFRTEVTENKEGLITEVFSYVYSIELRGRDPFSDRNVKCVVLSNTKNISFNDIQWGEEGYALEILKEYEPEEAILVSVQLCEL